MERWSGGVVEWWSGVVERWRLECFDMCVCHARLDCCALGLLRQHNAPNWFGSLSFFCGESHMLAWPMANEFSLISRSVISKASGANEFVDYDFGTVGHCRCCGLHAYVDVCLAWPRMSMTGCRLSNTITITRQCHKACRITGAWHWPTTLAKLSWLNWPCWLRLALNRQTAATGLIFWHPGARRLPADSPSSPSRPCSETVYQHP